MGLLLLTGQSQPNPRTLFANGEQGLAIDVEEAYLRGWVWQDANAVTRATAAGDPVGLILDSSRGGLDRLGSELVTNRTFTTNTTGWTAANSAVLSVVGGQISIVNGAADYGAARQTITTVAGRWYQVSYDFVSVNGARGFFNVGTFAGNNGLYTSGAIASSRSSTVVFLATQTSSFLSMGHWDNNAATEVRFDNISVREIPGNHAYVTASGSRPVLARTPDGGRRNLLTYSEQFDNAAWTTGVLNRTANTTTAPNGTTTADTLTAITVGNYREIRQTFSLAAGDTRTFSCYLKAGTSSVGFLQASDFVANNRGRYFNLSSGTLGGVSGLDLGTTVSLVSSSITDVGNGWYRCSITVTVSSTTSWSFTVGVVDADNSPLCQQDKTLFVWGAQLETGTLTAYQKVGLTSDVTESGKRDCWGLLFDGSDDSLASSAIDFATWTQTTRRNLLVDTESFGTSNWIKQESTVSENTTTAPDGTTTADTLIPSTNSSIVHRIAQNAVTTTNGAALTFSVYAKSDGTYKAVRITIDSPSTFGDFDLENGVASGGTIQSVGNGWYRCSINLTSGTSSLPRIWCFDTYANATGEVAFTGNGTNGIYIWGAQLEAGTLTDYQRVGTDKMTVMAGVRKLSDAARGTICELTATIASNNGGFHLTAPNAASDTFAFESKGTSLADAVASSIAAPATRVLTGIGNIGGDSTSLRVNGVVADTDTGDQGRGNYANAVLYISSRGGSSLRFNGLIYSLIVRGATTPTGTIADFERNLLARRCGVTF